jgi:hypothetical protein
VVRTGGDGRRGSASFLHLRRRLFTLIKAVTVRPRTLYG